jgi:hypothetical protein
MGILLMQLGGLVFAGSLAWIGIKGLRGIPDRSGHQTTRTTGIVSLVLAVIFACVAIIGPLMLPRW